VENRKSVRIQFLENRIVQKFDIRSDGFRTQTACSPKFKLKMPKINFTCIQYECR